MRIVWLPNGSEVVRGRNSIITTVNRDFSSGEEIRIASENLEVLEKAVVVTSFGIPFNSIQDVFLKDNVVPEMRTWDGAYNCIKDEIRCFNRGSEVTFLLVERI